ncbi:GGDEF domain-containing protein [Actinoplanes oblitus]|uniref:GGDEF domain-containing protein n=1 Tax=Actinoplanes oblitus TaxID=3040509 RepID=A0ABY8WAF3_9ACTN|nr:GGDEF domain-containing protein [Actinoplanes oblitus]WIM93927.1 GGDEF domain-containing protein [Actinoplanes oblitus]
MWRDRVLAPLAVISAAVLGFFALDLGTPREKMLLCWVVAPLTDLALFALSRRVAREPSLTGPSRRFWRAMGAAGLIFAAGDGAQLVYVLRHPHQDVFAFFPVQTTLGVLGVVLLCVTALFHPSRMWSRGTRIRVLLDAAIVNTAVGALIWCLLTRSGMTHAGPAGYLSAFFGCGVVLCGGFLAVKIGMSGSSPIVMPAAIPVVVATGIQAVGNALLPTDNIAGVIFPSLLVLGPCLLMVASPRIQLLEMRAGRGERVRRDPGTGRRYSSLPYLGTVLCAIILVVALLTQGLGLSAWGALAGLLLNVALVVVRQLLALAENNGLLDRLDESLAEIRRRERRQEALLRHASEITAIVRTDGVVKYLNPAVERIIGGSLHDYVGRHLLDLMHPGDAPRIEAELAEVFATPGAKRHIEMRVQHDDDSWRWLSAVAVNLVEEPGIGGIVINARDVTEERELRERLRFQAGHDALTGLANRRLFTDRIGVAGTAEVAVLLVDLNGFKQINDTYGHATGDAVLRHVAEQLLACTDAGDLAARLGGDEFAVLVRAGAEEAERIAERLRAALAVPAEIGGRRLTVGASVGVAAGPADQPDHLLHAADLRMYADKQRSRELAR